MKITDAIVSALLKRGMVYEARDVDTKFEIPVYKNDASGNPLLVAEKVTIYVKADNISVKVDRDN